MKQNPNSNQAFSIVELLILLFILGIFIAVGLPAFIKARSKYNSTNRTSSARTCQQNLLILDGAKEQYALEFRLKQGTPVTMSELIKPPGSQSDSGYIRTEPTCPGGGTYTLHPIGQDPTCSLGINDPLHRLPK